jgi:hypothetical protein
LMPGDLFHQHIIAAETVEFGGGFHRWVGWWKGTCFKQTTTGR